MGDHEESGDQEWGMAGHQALVARWVMHSWGAHDTEAWGATGGQGGGRPREGQGTYVRCEHRVAGRRLVHGHRQAEGACPQAAVLQQWDPLGRG